MSTEPTPAEDEWPAMKGMCVCGHPGAAHDDKRYCHVMHCGCDTFWPKAVSLTPSEPVSPQPAMDAKIELGRGEFGVGSATNRATGLHSLGIYRLDKPELVGHNLNGKGIISEMPADRDRLFIEFHNVESLDVLLKVLQATRQLMVGEASEQQIADNEGPLPSVSESPLPQPNAALELLADISHLWIDGYIAKTPNSAADASISESVFDRVDALLEVSGITVDYCGWRYRESKAESPLPVQEPQEFDDNFSEAAAFAGITSSEGTQFHLYLQYLLGKLPAPSHRGFLDAEPHDGNKTASDLIAEVYEGKLTNRDDTSCVTVRLPHNLWRLIQASWYQRKCAAPELPVQDENPRLTAFREYRNEKDTPELPVRPQEEPTYDEVSLADAQAAEQYAVAYVAKVGASKETMIDAISTLRAQLTTAWRALKPSNPAPTSESDKAEL